jgi:hypothetical protein
MAPRRGARCGGLPRGGDEARRRVRGREGRGGAVCETNRTEMLGRRWNAGRKCAAAAASAWRRRAAVAAARARMEGAARRTGARRGSRRARTLRGPQGACRSARRRTDTRRPNAAAAPRRHARARARAGEREGTTRTRAGPALAVGREVRAKPSNEISIFLFPNIFQILHFCLKFKFEDENEVFRNLSQNKSCSKFYFLQLSYRTFFQIPDRF